MERVIYGSDWLASEPFFYNEITGKYSHNINDVIDYSNLEFDPEGLSNYLDFGYSVLEQTPIKNVKFLRHSSKLLFNMNEKLTVQYFDDPVNDWLDYRLTESDIIELIRDRVQKWEASVSGEIVIPTSGGYDSRLLNWCISDKSRIRAFSYGVSNKQYDSFEVVYAKKLSEILGIKWEQVFLGDFHEYIKEWIEHYGVSTHAHGMYHIEFYNKIKMMTDGDAFMSGIGGDWWSSAVNCKPIDSHESLIEIGYTHGMHATSSKALFNTKKMLLRQFFFDNKHIINDWNCQLLLMSRFKIILISYLKKLPQLLDYKVFTPFLDIDIAMAMLNLPPERRLNRQWQKDFFTREGLNIEDMNLKASRVNTLNFQAMHKVQLEPLNVNLLKEVMESEYIHWINKQLQVNRFRNQALRLLSVPKVGGGLRRLGFKDNRLKAYCAYLTLKPIEDLISIRDQQACP